MDTHSYFDNMKKVAAIRRRNEIQNSSGIIHNLVYPELNSDSTAEDLIENLQLWIGSRNFANGIKCNVIKNCASRNTETRCKIQANGLQIIRRDNPFLKPDCLSSIIIKFYYEIENRKLYDIMVEADFMDNNYSECYKKFSLIDSTINKFSSSRNIFNDIISMNFYACREPENILDVDFKEMSDEKPADIIKNQWNNLLYMLQGMLGKKFNTMVGSIPQIMLENYNGTIGEFYAKLLSFYLPANLRDVQLAFTNYNSIKDSTFSNIHKKQKDFIISVKEGMKSFSNLYRNF